MLLTKHKTMEGSRWALDGRFLSPTVNLSTLLEMSRANMLEALVNFSTPEISLR